MRKNPNVWIENMMRKHIPHDPIQEMKYYGRNDSKVKAVPVLIGLAAITLGFIRSKR